MRTRALLTPLVLAAVTTAGLTIAPTPALAAGPDISVTNTKAHLDQLQSIANANGGNRSTGRPGYKASVDWVKAKLDAAGYTTTVQSFSTSSGTSYNLVADLPGGDLSSVVMFGAHLDSVSVGPGINDNGSGSAGILETALAYTASGQTPRNHVRFGFWGAEELGLLGSKYYVGQLTTAQRTAIRSYQNFDMIASPNVGYFVYDDNAVGNGVRNDFTAYYDTQGIPWEYIDVQGRSDHAAFRSSGIATGGIFSGAESIKTSAQASKWGGTAGRAFDACYHRSCDTNTNLDLVALDKNVDTIGYMVWRYAAKDYGTTTPPTGSNLLANPGFESGAVSWTGTSGPITSGAGRPAHSGTWKLWLGGNGTIATETEQQTVTIPSAATTASLSFWGRFDTAETGSTVYDTLKVQVVASGVTTTLATYSNVGADATWTQRTFDLTAYRGKSVTVKFLATEDSSAQTSFVIDDTALSTT
ncbi:M20/M25/M40 family metallo-hydrolase [Terrabacter sp. LjRoot27]|uniref:M20/M25/M40 family metallo-hydrolase n=1 Tax=Terrabacter sp. LjRoot27 TaxID=3342306 RepID=UPI003ED032FB